MSSNPFLFYRFVRNCVPQLSDITIAASVSMTYFAFTIFNLLLLGLVYEIVAYGMSSAIKWLRVISIMYGVILIILAILEIALEKDDMVAISKLTWMRLSRNEKSFFDNDREQLMDQRNENNLFVGIFSIVIGCCFVLIGIVMFKLHEL